MQQRPHPGDSQIVELLGRNRLIDELTRDGLEVAVPIRDRGIDLIAYADRDLSEYVARPIQMKAAWTEAFAVDRKYERFPGLLLAYVWNVGDPRKAQTFAMPYAEAVRIAEEMGWTRTPSWERGNYVVSRPSGRLIELLLPFQMRSGSFRRLVIGE